MTSPLPERARPESCLSDLALERLLVSELAAGQELSEVEAHLASCPSCRRRRDELAAAPEQQPDRLWWQRQMAPRRRVSPAVRGGLLAFAAVALLLVVLRPKGRPVDSESDTRTKGGGLALEIVARRPDGQVEPVVDGTVLHPGDAIRFIVTTSEPGVLAVVGMDAAGQTSVYFPIDGAAASIGAGKRELPGSIILDETTGDERLQAVLCQAHPAQEALLAAGKAALAAAANVPSRIDRLDLPCRQAGSSIHKQAASP